MLLTAFSGSAWATESPNEEEETIEPSEITDIQVNRAASGKVVIVLDPGHGGTDDGMSCTWNGRTINEKTLNLKIATYCKQELENTYANVTVYMTRSDDRAVALVDRVKYAASVGATMLVSIHNNASGSVQALANGAEALIPNGKYRPALTTQAKKTAGQILTQLHAAVGVKNRGFVQRNSTTQVYPNGAVADYYSILRNATLLNIPSTIIEHAFMDNKNDYRSYLSTDAELKALGVADAKGIAAAYGLKEKPKANTAAQNGDAPYTDVYDDAWYYDNVVAAYQHQFMKGQSSTTFAPDKTLTRAEMIQMIYNYANIMGERSETDAQPLAFEDVAENAWYCEAINWASANGITVGTDETHFSPNQMVTREQVAVMLYRYTGGEAQENALKKFSDAASVSAWAADAMSWACSVGVINGEQSNGVYMLNPHGDAIRAQAATMIENYRKAG